MGAFSWVWRYHQVFPTRTVVITPLGVFSSVLRLTPVVLSRQGRVECWCFLTPIHRWLKRQQGRCGSKSVLDVRKREWSSINNDNIYSVDIGASITVVLIFCPIILLLMLVLIVAAVLRVNAGFSCNHLLPFWCHLVALVIDTVCIVVVSAALSLAIQWWRRDGLLQRRLICSCECSTLYLDMLQQQCWKTVALHSIYS